MILNNKVKIINEKVLSKDWSTLSKFTYEYTLDDGQVQTQVREAYNRGDGITALLYNPDKKTVLLTRQFRMPTYLNGNESGLMIEACAGKLEKENPLKEMLREIEEETGHRVTQIKKVFESYMSPGSVTEIVHFYLARYGQDTKVSSGGGLDSEQENIEVLEMPFSKAMAMIESSEIKDAKTIMLLQYAFIGKLL